MRVALAQTCPGSADANDRSAWASTLEANIQDARTHCLNAVSRGAEVVVFPEYFLQGLVDQGRQYMALLAPHLFAHLSRLASANHISIVGTMVTVADDGYPDLPSPFEHLHVADTKLAERDAAVLSAWTSHVNGCVVTDHEPQLYNTAFFIDGERGERVAEYVKRNLWHPERQYLKPGQDRHQTFETKWGRCSFVICWDIGHPGAAQELADLDVDIVFAPTYWIGYDSAPVIHQHHHNPPSYENQVLSSLSFARSFETETAWIMCNPGGSRQEGYIGGSGVWMPLKGKLGGLDAPEVGVKCVDVDLGVLRDARKLYQIRQDWGKRKRSL